MGLEMRLEVTVFTLMQYKLTSDTIGPNSMLFT